MSKSVLLGMNNPISEDPRLALWPSPKYSTGGRILDLINDQRLQAPIASPAGFAVAFERANLLIGGWRKEEARQAGRWARRYYDVRRSTVIVFGEKVWGALGLPSGHPLVLPTSQTGGEWRRLPHPSGRNLWYNDPQNRLVAAILLRELYDRHGSNE